MTLDGWAGANFEDGFRAPKSITDGDADSEGALDNFIRAMRITCPVFGGYCSPPIAAIAQFAIGSGGTHNLGIAQTYIYSAECPRIFKYDDEIWCNH